MHMLLQHLESVLVSRESSFGHRGMHLGFTIYSTVYPLDLYKIIYILSTLKHHAQRGLQQAAKYHVNRKEILWQLLNGQWDKLGTPSPLCPHLVLSICSLFPRTATQLCLRQSWSKSTIPSDSIDILS